MVPEFDPVFEEVVVSPPDFEPVLVVDSDCESVFVSDAADPVSDGDAEEVDPVAAADASHEVS